MRPTLAQPLDGLSRLEPQTHLETWRQELIDSYSSVEDLYSAGLINLKESTELAALGAQFKVRVTPYYSKLIQPDLDCPIRKQAIPLLGEVDPSLPDWATDLCQKIYGRPSPWTPDAIGDVQNLAAPRITHRYKNRAILHISSSCAVYCRFCFRKSHLNDHDIALYEGPLEPAFQYLKSNSEVTELILTGGDPLSLTDAALKKMFQRIAEIPHLKILRIHTRMPVTLPSRITPALLELFSQEWPFSLYLVSHFNHTRELTPEALSKLRALKRNGVTTLNQSVLLNGINDSVNELVDLFQGLYEAGVIPYYLHHPDWTPGTFHFRVSIERGKALYSQLRGLLSGPALPEYILDIPEGYGKISPMDASFRKVCEFPEKNDSGSLRGALYEIASPSTRKGQGAPLQYLDLFPA